MTTPASLDNGDSTHYAFGLTVRDYRGLEAAELFLAQEMESRVEDEKTDGTLTAKLEPLAGHYWSAEDRDFQEIVLEQDTLRLIPFPGYEFELVPQAQNRFAMQTPWWVADLTFDATDESIIMRFQVQDQEQIGTFERFEPRRLSGNQLKDYVGAFYSPELRCRLRLREGRWNASIRHR